MTSLGSLPLPLSTTWAVLESLGATITSDGDALVVSVDVEGHRWCHAVSVLDPARIDEAPHWLARAAQEFPAVTYPAIGLPTRPDREVWRRQPCRPLDGAAVEWWPQHWIALEASTVAPRHALPAGYSVVPIDKEEHWVQFADLPSAGGEEYRQTWTALKRRRQDEGRAMFFAGLHQGRVVATGGIVLCDLGSRQVARFEDIETQPEHRQRGLASHLLAAAHTWAMDHGAGSSVLVGDAEGEAVDLYHHIGFIDSDEAWMVLPRLAL